MPTAQFCSMSAVNYWRWALKNHQRLTHFLVKSLIRTAVLCSDLRLVSELRLCISCYCFPTLGKASPFVLICLWLYWTTFKTGSKPTTESCIALNPLPWALLTPSSTWTPEHTAQGYAHSPASLNTSHMHRLHILKYIITCTPDTQIPGAMFVNHC